MVAATVFVLVFVALGLTVLFLAFGGGHAARASACTPSRVGATAPSGLLLPWSHC